MPKSNKQVLVDFIVELLEKGDETENICAVFCTKFHLTDRTFYNHLKIAQQQHADKQAVLKKELAAVDKQAAIEARKKHIMTSQERKMILTKIAEGKLKLKKWWIGKDYEISKTVVPDYMDRKNAISELNRMDGSYAPMKLAQTTKDGVDIQQPAEILILPPSQTHELEIKEAE